MARCWRRAEALRADLKMRACMLAVRGLMSVGCGKIGVGHRRSTITFMHSPIGVSLVASEKSVRLVKVAGRGERAAPARSRPLVRLEW